MIHFNPEKRMSTIEILNHSYFLNILQEVKENEEIIVAGMMKVFPGMPVTVNKKIVQATSPHDTHLASSAP